MWILASFLALFGCAGAPCTVDGVEYADGASWACADGCNTCSCDDGSVGATEMYCGATCTDETGANYTEGDEWTCADGCNTCSCQPDGSILSTDLACS